MGGVVAHVILVSALSPNPSFFLFLGTSIQLWDLLGQGPGLGLGPGLDKTRIPIPYTQFLEPCTKHRLTL